MPGPLIRTWSRTTATPGLVKKNARAIFCTVDLPEWLGVKTAKPSLHTGVKASAFILQLLLWV